MACPNKDVIGYRLENEGYREFIDGAEPLQPKMMKYKLIQETKHGDIIMAKIMSSELAMEIRELLNGKFTVKSGS